MLVRDDLSADMIRFIAGAEDVAHLPVFIDALDRRGFSDDDVAGILGGNALRLYGAVFTAAAPEVDATLSRSP